MSSDVIYYLKSLRVIAKVGFLYASYLLDLGIEINVIKKDIALKVSLLIYSLLSELYNTSISIVNREIV